MNFIPLRFAPRRSTFGGWSWRSRPFSYRNRITSRFRWPSRCRNTVNVWTRARSRDLFMFSWKCSSRRSSLIPSIYSLKMMRWLVSSACFWSCSRVALAEASCCRVKTMVNIPETTVGRAASDNLNKLKHGTCFKCSMYRFLVRSEPKLICTIDDIETCYSFLWTNKSVSVDNQSE